MTLPPKLVEKIYGEEGDVKGLSKMCPKCRRKAAWEGIVYSEHERENNEYFPQSDDSEAGKKI
jgi:hypothetical protein